MKCTPTCYVPCQPTCLVSCYPFYVCSRPCSPCSRPCTPCRPCCEPPKPPPKREKFSNFAGGAAGAPPDNKKKVKVVLKTKKKEPERKESKKNDGGTKKGNPTDGAGDNQVITTTESKGILNKIDGDEPKQDKVHTTQITVGKDKPEAKKEEKVEETTDKISDKPKESIASNGQGEGAPPEATTGVCTPRTKCMCFQTGRCTCPSARRQIYQPCGTCGCPKKVQNMRNPQYSTCSTCGCIKKTNRAFNEDTCKTCGCKKTKSPIQQSKPVVPVVPKGNTCRTCGGMKIEKVTSHPVDCNVVPKIKNKNLKSQHCALCPKCCANMENVVTIKARNQNLTYNLSDFHC